MPQQVPCEFTSYSFTDEELLRASILSPEQEMLIRTDMAQIASTLLNQNFDPLNPQSFVQDQAHQKGQLSAYRYLLLRSEESKIQLKAHLSRPSNQSL